MRRFWRGEKDLLGAFVTRLAGSSDLYEHSGRPPYCSINFITSHDGFTLSDLVSYKEKHNEANGEGNRDGDNNNHSDNYGVEGPTKRPEIENLRVRQIKNMLATLMLSQGIPMLVFGDEARRTQKGNNNAYCQDNAISWFNWDLVKQNAPLVRFASALINFRRDQPTVRRDHFLTGQPKFEGDLPDVSWFSALGTAVDWHGDDSTLTALLKAVEPEHDPEGAARDVLILVNATSEPREFILPPLAKGTRWRLFLDTAAAPPYDVYPDLDGPPPPRSRRLTLSYRSMCVFVADKRRNGK
jgi:isoamylase